MALSLTSCSFYREPALDDTWRAHVNENCRVFRNYWDRSDDALMRHVFYMIEGTDWKRIRLIRWNGADCGTDHRRGRIITVVVYYGVYDYEQ